MTGILPKPVLPEDHHCTQVVAPRARIRPAHVLILSFCSAPLPPLIILAVIALDTNIGTGDDERRKPSCLGADARDKAGMLWLVVCKNIKSQP
jgi:hypothetical protein